MAAQDAVSRIFFYLGIDVPMTPITSDMMLRWDEINQKRAYTSHFFLDIADREGRAHRVEGKDLEFYFFRIPILLMVDYQWDGAPIEGFVDLLCRNLNRKLGIQTRQWQILNSQDLSVLLAPMICP